MEGWAQIDLDATLFPAAPRALQFFDAGAPLATGGTNFHAVYVAGSGPLSVTLAWSDYPATLSAAQQLVNDLYLALLGPDGEVWLPGGAAGPDRTRRWSSRRP